MVSSFVGGGNLFEYVLYRSKTTHRNLIISGLEQQRETISPEVSHPN